MIEFSKLTTDLATGVTTGVNPLFNRVLWLKKITLPRVLVAAILLMVIHIIVQQRLRYARMRYLMRKYPFKTRESYRFMTDQQAFEIQKAILQLEFPFMALKSLQFALFRVSFLVNFVTDHCLQLFSELRRQPDIWNPNHIVSSSKNNRVF